MSDVVLYPRGYTSVITEDMIPNFVDVVKSEGDAELLTLYKLYMNRTVNIEGWELQKRVIVRAAQLFGDFQQWFLFQAVGNDYVYDLNFAFLKDTIEFIRTGRREMSISTWRGLVLDNPKIHRGEASRKRFIDSFGTLDDIRENPIGRWVAQHDGFADLLITLYILFGSERSHLMLEKPVSYGQHAIIS